MDYQTYPEAQAAALAQFQEGKYAEAMRLFDDFRVQFPDDWVDIDYFRSCLAVRLEDPALAYQIFDNLLAEDIWYAEDLFRLSPSFAPLQGRDEFEKRVAAHVALREQSGGVGTPVLHTRLPAEGAGPYAVVFHLHGNASGALAEIDHWQAAADAGWLVAVPNSSQTFWAGGGAFWPDHESARGQIVKHLADLKSQFEVATDKIIFSGFSMGGDVALDEVLKGEIAPACGFILVAPGGPMFGEPESFKPLIEAAQGRSLRGVILRSDGDTAIEGEKIDAVVNLLNAGGVATRLEKYSAAGHVFPSDFGARLPGLLAWITKEDSG